MPYQPQRDLTGKHPNDTYKFFVSVDGTGSLFDGTGSQIQTINATSSFSTTSSFVIVSSTSISSSWSSASLTTNSSSFASSSITSSYSLSSLISTSSSFASSSLTATSASWSSASIFSTSSSFASSSLTASILRGTGSLTAQSFILSGSYTTNLTGAYILSNRENGKLIVVNFTTNSYVQVSSTLSQGFACSFIQTGSGQIMITGSGVNIRNRAALSSSYGLYSVISLLQLDANNYILQGDLA